MNHDTYTLDTMLLHVFHFSSPHPAGQWYIRPLPLGYFYWFGIMSK